MKKAWKQGISEAERILDTGQYDRKMRSLLSEETYLHEKMAEG